MSRPVTLRRRNPQVALESLESRELLTAGGPSAEAQYMLELINAARTNPAAMADQITSTTDPNVAATVRYYGVDMGDVKQDIATSSPRPALAWSDSLADAAIKHSADMANNGYQSHLGSDGSTLDQRLNASGYTNRSVSGENAYAYANSVDHAMSAFLIDWGVSDHGHRNNLLQPDASPDRYYKEVGIGIMSSNKPGFGPRVITQDFGTKANSNSYILGVVFNDNNRDRRYSLGEGQGNVEINVVNVDTGETRTTLTWDAGGGYQVQVPNGTYDVTAKVNGQVVRTSRVSVGDQNVKVDYNLSDPWQQPTPAPTPTPTPAPVPFTFSNASTVAPANIALQQLQAPTTKPARAGWFSNWSSWSARRIG